MPARGPHSFGWDPIFLPDGHDLTYAEMSSAVKNSISHRRKAINALCEHLQSQSVEEPPAAKSSKLGEERLES